MKYRRNLSLLGLAVALSWLSGCGPVAILAGMGGGGGGGGGSNPPPTLSAKVDGFTGIAIAPVTPTISGGLTSSSWSVSPPLPSGLTMSATTGVISGTPLVESSATHKVTAKVTGGNATGDVPVNIKKAAGNFAVGVIPGSNTMRSYEIDTVKNLSAKSSTATGAVPTHALMHPSQQFAFALNNASKTVSSHTVTSAGVLGAAPGNPAATGVNPVNMVMHPQGSAIFVLNSVPFDISVSVITIDQSTGQLTAVANPFKDATIVFANDIAIAPDGGHLYISHSVGISVLQINGTALSLIQTRAETQFSVSRLLVVGRSLQALDTGNSSVRSYDLLGTGLIDGAAAKQTQAGFLPNTMTAGPTGSNLYVGYFDQKVRAFSVDGNGDLTAGSTANMSGNSTSLNVHPSGGYLLATIQGQASGLGRLDLPITGSGQPIAAVVDQMASLAYVRSEPPKPAIFVGSGGRLTPTTLEDDSVTSKPRFFSRSAVVHTRAGVAYVVSADAKEILVYANPADEPQVAFRVTTAKAARTLQLDTTGARLFVMHDDGTYSTYLVDAHSGKLSR